MFCPINIDFPKKEMHTFYEVKVWLEPEISVAKVINLSEMEVNKILEIVKSRKEEIDEFWKKHFS